MGTSKRDRGKNAEEKGNARRLPGHLRQGSGRPLEKGVERLGSLNAPANHVHTAWRFLLTADCLLLTAEGSFAPAVENLDVLRALLSRAGHLISAGLPGWRGELGLFSGPFPARCKWSLPDAPNAVAPAPGVRWPSGQTVVPWCAYSIARFRAEVAGSVGGDSQLASFPGAEPGSRVAQISRERARQCKPAQGGMQRYGVGLRRPRRAYPWSKYRGVRG